MNQFKDYFGILIPSLAFCVALYTFLSNNSTFKEFGKRLFTPVMLHLCATIVCSIAFAYSQILSSLGTNQTSNQPSSGIFATILTIVFLLLYVLGWFFIIQVFWSIYGSLYHLRKKRFLKYTAPVAWLHERFFHDKFYEDQQRPRSAKRIDSLSIGNDSFSRIKKGGSVLVLYDNTFDYHVDLCGFILETIDNNETIDYIVTDANPTDICRHFSDEEIIKISNGISFIDCFSTHYGFDDKVLKHKKKQLSEKGITIYEARTFSEIHSASNDSWYRFRKKLRKKEENTFRIPHRTVYDTLSSLIDYSSQEVYLTYLRHVIASERSYGMISIILEPNTLDKNLKDKLSRITDIVLDFQSRSNKRV